MVLVLLLKDFFLKMLVFYFYIIHFFINLFVAIPDKSVSSADSGVVNCFTVNEIGMETKQLKSGYLDREVVIDLYKIQANSSTKKTKILFFNDGQDLRRMNFKKIFQDYCSASHCDHLLVVGIIPQDRMNEYGTSVAKDYLGRGAKAQEYQLFITHELIPFLDMNYVERGEYSFAGFSLGGLSAFDITWNAPHLFHKVGVFSGSFWWRSTTFSEFFPDANRIVVDYLENSSSIQRNQRFWFQVGEHDETSDRNNNGIIDAIDDTLDVISALKQGGINEEKINYTLVENGTHSLETWSFVMPDFIRWWLED